MSQLRYVSAFLLSSLTFLLLYFGFISLPKVEKKLRPTPSKVIKIALIAPVKKIVKPVVKKTPKVATPSPIVPPIILKKIVKKEPKKIIKKKIIKKKVIKKIKPKKIIKKKKIVRKKIIRKKVIKKSKPRKVIKKKKIIQKKTIKKKIVQEKIVIKKPVETYVPIAPPVYVPPKPVLKPVLKASTTPQPKVKNNYYKKAFLRNVRSKIIANKTYPKIAKRRHIEGSVKVRFDITERGHVSNIRFINGKRIFQKSIRKTLERTFPMGIPNELKNELPIMNVSVVLHFNIR